MKLILKMERGELKGSLYSEKYGFTYKVKFKKEIVARSYCYFKNKDDALEHMDNDMTQLIGMLPLFDINKLRKV